jgi:Mrp family chromosome partitioning ATPase
MDWLQKALDKSKNSESADFQFQSSSALKDDHTTIDDSAKTLIISHPATTIIPPNSFDQRLALAKQLDKQSAAIYNFLAAKTTQLLKSLKASSLAVTSPTSGAGSTLTAANLAISMARTSHQTVVLVELNMQKPAFYRYFGLDDQQKGLNEHVNDAIPLNKLLVNISGTNLTLLTAGIPVDQSQHNLGSQKIREFVHNLGSIYNNSLIIFDLPALLDTEDALAFLANVDASLLVLEDGLSTANQINQCTDILKNHGYLGSILNKVKDVA